MEEREVVLDAEHIVKQFPGVLANDDVSLKLHRGEILALLGENGAGKSTLMNIIYGLYHPDAGTIRLKGRDVRFASPREAIRSGIGMVHQHFQLVPVMTVAENVVLGEEADVAYQGKDKPALRWALKWLSSIVVFVAFLLAGWALGETKYLAIAAGLGLVNAVVVAVPPLARLIWGITWRVGLVFMALWIASRIELMARVGLTDIALRQEVQTLSRERDPKVKEIEERSGTYTYAVKSRYVSAERVDFDWSQSALEVAGNEDKIGATIELAQEAMAPYRDDGIPGWLIDAIDSAPPWVYSISGLILFLLIGFFAIRSWRGLNAQIGVLRPEDFVVLAALIAGYLVLAAARLVDDKDTEYQILLLALLGVGLVFALWRTWLQRQNREERGGSALDSAMDAVLNALDNLTQIRNPRAAAQRVRDLSQQYGLEVDPEAVIEKLPVGTQQRVEIVKALYRQADILILDEPTAVLTPQEGEELFKIMRELAAQGVSIIFITHKLKEVFEVATNIVVMRGGRVVGTTTPKEATEASLAEMMVGREVILHIEKDEARPAEHVLQVHGLAALNDRGAPALKAVSFEVRAGEVLGIAGVQGNGQTELVEVLTGLRNLTGGSVQLLGTELQPEVQPQAKLKTRLTALVIDTVMAILFGLLIGSFVAYFGEERFSDASMTTKVLVGALTYVIVDWLYFWGGWQAFNGTLGMAVFSLQIVDAADRKPNIVKLLAYYLAFLVLRVVHLALVPLAIFNMERAAVIVRAIDGRFGLHMIRREKITPRRIKDTQTSHVPEDRQRHGLVKPYSVADNLVLNDYYEYPFAQEPDQAELPFALLRYLVVASAIVLALGALGLWAWDQWVWTALLDAYNVPEHLRTYQMNVDLGSARRAVLQWPFIISVFLAMGLALFSGLVAHLVTMRLFGFGPVKSAIQRLDRNLQITLWRLQGGNVSDFVDKRGGLMRNRDAIYQHANNLIAQYDIRTPGPDTAGGSLSGGNQQKMIVAREFSRKPRLLIAAQPTRGIDVGSIEFIHRQIIDQRDEGAAVLLVSAELDEIMSLADRIAVMYKGEIIDTVPAKGATREQLGLLMAGIHAPSA